MINADDMDIVPLKTFDQAGDNDQERGNGNGNCSNGDETERVPLNGETSASVHTAEEGQIHESHKQKSAVYRMKKEMNKKVWKVRVWMVFIVLLVVLIPIVVVISMAICAALHEDVDDKYDPTSFNISRHFNGSFQVTNEIFTEELLSPSSNRSQTLAAALRQKLAGVYSASPALGRYFSKANISSFRNGSVIAEYGLKFLLPKDHGELRNFTLSREMVYNVFRQYLYDQETEDPLYIDPASLDMS